MLADIIIADIRIGQDHYAAVYIRPSTIRRYYHGRRMPRARNMVVYIELVFDGTPIADTTYNPGRIRVPDQWWRSSRLNRIDNGLLGPDKTPFQWLEIVQVQ